ncbi:MAG: TetR family transcriptional regulator, partial [Actinomycetota bacterium]
TVDGRVPGRRGRATRERLLRCTADLLEKTSYRDLTVIDIAECAGTSPATFYQYFPDVEAAVLALAGALGDEAERLTSLIRSSPWEGKGGSQTAVRLVDAFLDMWERHRPVLRVVDLATAEGDMRFQNVRTHFLNELTVALRDVIDEFKRHGHHPKDLEPMGQAAVLVSMLAHVAAHRYGFEFWGIRTRAIRDSSARLLHAGVTGNR